MSDFWDGYEPEPTKPATITKDELTEPLGCVVVRPLLANSTTPPAAQRQWVGLTDEEKRQIFEREDYQGWLDYINAIEDKLRSKNNG
jgi:hypothetical protein